MIIPGIFESDFAEIERKVKNVEQFAHLIQIDVADGELVSGKTILNIAQLDRIKTGASFELHLMVKYPLRFVQERVHNVSRVCTQIEAEDDKDEFIDKAKSLSYLVGLSLNPQTPTEALDPFYQKINFVQFMSVDPGGQGREFQWEVLDKIKAFKQKYWQMPAQIDGGVNGMNLQDVLGSGVDDVIIGSALFNKDDIRRAYIKFKEMQNNG